MTESFDFFKTEMPDSRKADYCLGWADGSVYIDFNLTSNKLISLHRISFDGYGCCDLKHDTNLLDADKSRQFIEELSKDELDQEKLTMLVIEIININKENIWTDALEEYHLIDKEL